MERIIDGIRYEGKLLPDTWDISVVEVAGHREISARNAVIWGEAADHLAYVRHGDGFDGQATPENLAKWAAQDLADALVRAEKSRLKAAAKAKTRARHFMKLEAFDEMLTLTYRVNMQDFERSQKHFKEWIRRMKKALGGFRYCAGWEPQDRGAIHWHVATHKLPKMAKYKGVKVKAWEVGTRIWRDIVGDVEISGPLMVGQERSVMSGGLCYVGGKPKFAKARRRNMSIAKIAAYVSKYIQKNCLDRPAEKNRYSRSNSAKDTIAEVVGPMRPGEVRNRFVVPAERVRKTRYRLAGMTLAELAARLCDVVDGDTIVSHRIGPFKDSYWLVTEPRTTAMVFSPN